MIKRRLGAILAASVLGIMSIMTPVFAIANPDSIAVNSVKVFQNLFETGDMMFVAYVDVAYASAPSETASTAFSFSIYDGSGNLKVTRGLIAYNDTMISIYQTAAQVTAGFTWGAAYTIKLQGNPALFGSLVEGTNVKTFALTSDDWITGVQAASRSLLREFVLQEYTTIEIAKGVTYLVFSNGAYYLNSAGMALAVAAIPGITTACPTLSQVSSSTVDIDTVTSTGDLATEYTLENKLGTAIYTNFVNLGNWLGITPEMAAGLFISFICILAASIVFVATGNGMASLLVGAVPFMILGNAVALIPVVVLWIAVIIIFTWASYHFFVR